MPSKWLVKAHHLPAGASLAESRAVISLKPCLMLMPCHIIFSKREDGGSISDPNSSKICKLSHGFDGEYASKKT